MNVNTYIQSTPPAENMGNKERGEGNIKTWIFLKQKGYFRWNKKHFSQFFKDFCSSNMEK